MPCHDEYRTILLMLISALQFDHGFSGFLRISHLVSNRWRSGRLDRRFCLLYHNRFQRFQAAEDRKKFISQRCVITADGIVTTSKYHKTPIAAVDIGPIQWIPVVVEHPFLF